MRIILFLRPIAVALSLAALAHAVGADKAKVADAPSGAVADTVDVTNARWVEIKGLGYDNREAFLPGFKRLQARLDVQISELAARRATMKGDANTQDWDFAMKELGNARSYLSGSGELIGKASPDS